MYLKLCRVGDSFTIGDRISFRIADTATHPKRKALLVAYLDSVLVSGWFLVGSSLPITEEVSLHIRGIRRGSALLAIETIDPVIQVIGDQQCNQA